MTLWPGVCVVHETFSEKKLVALRERHPEAAIIAHPECEAPLAKVQSKANWQHSRQGIWRTSAAA